MADFLRGGQEWLAEGVSDGTLSHSVLYTRAAASVALNAQAGRTPFRTTDARTGSVTIVRSDRDYLIAAADLILSATLVKPQAGDRITDSEDGKIYEVSRVVPDEPCWRNADPEGLLLRVHCVKAT